MTKPTASPATILAINNSTLSGTAASKRFSLFMFSGFRPATSEALSFTGLSCAISAFTSFVLAKLFGCGMGAAGSFLGGWLLAAVSF